MNGENYNYGKTLPASIIDFVLKDNRYGIASPEFKAALKRGDFGNIIEGIEAAILNSEIRTKMHLTDDDRARLQIMVHNQIAENLRTEMA